MKKLILILVCFMMFACNTGTNSGGGGGGNNFVVKNTSRIDLTFEVEGEDDYYDGDAIDDTTVKAGQTFSYNLRPGKFAICAWTDDGFHKDIEFVIEEGKKITFTFNGSDLVKNR